MGYQSEIEALAEAEKIRIRLENRLSTAAWVARRVMDKKFSYRPPKDDQFFKSLRWAYSDDAVRVDENGVVAVGGHVVAPVFLTGDQGLIGREVRRMVREYREEESQKEILKSIAALRSEFVNSERKYNYAKQRVTKAAKNIAEYKLWNPDSFLGIEEYIDPYLAL